MKRIRKREKILRVGDKEYFGQSGILFEPLKFSRKRIKKIRRLKG